MDKFVDYKLTNHFANFKNFADAEIDISKPLTILIGKNGSGKTNFIEGTQVFAHLVEGTPLRKFSDMGKGGYCEVRGGLDNCVRFGTADFELRFNLAPGPSITSVLGSIGTMDYKIKIRRTAQREAVLLEERLLLISAAPEKGLRDRTLLSARRSGDKLKVEYDDFTGDQNPSISIPADRSVVSRYEEIIASSPATDFRKEIAPLAVGRMSDYLKTPYIFEFDTKAIQLHCYQPISAHTRLYPDGVNLSAALYGLKERKDPAAWKRITDIVRNLPEEPFSKMGFIKTSADDVMLHFHVKDDDGKKHLLDLRMLSDGTVRLLAILAALETVPVNSRIVLEEFDNGLHPSRVQRLIKHIYETAERRNLNVLVTTHNPAVMNALSEKEMESVVLCHRDPESGHSKFTSLMSVRDIDLMMLRGSLGDLVTDEIIEKYLSPDYRKNRAKLARKWKERYTL